MSKKFTFKTETPQSTGPAINFDDLNAHVVERVGAKDKPEAMIGIISGVIELGKQPQEDAKMKWEGTEAEKAAIEAKAAAGETQEYFEVVPHGQNNVPTLCKRWPVKAQSSVALTVDFPDNLVNRGQFFDENGEGEELPFRALLNNEFGMKGIGKIVGKPYSLREQKNDDGSWSLKNNTILFKLGQATNQLVDGKFKPAHLGSLIGEAAMFNVHVFLTESGDKKFLNEKLSFNGPVPKMMQSMIPKLDERHMYLINFKGEQDLDALKNLRQSVINTMKMAEDFEGSDIQKALIEIGKIKEGETSTAQKQEERNIPEQKKPGTKPKVASEPLDFDNFDDDIPF